MKVSSLPILLMIGAVFCFASMDATAKYLMKEIGPAQTIWARYTVQAILVTILILPKMKVYTYSSSGVQKQKMHKYHMLQIPNISTKVHKFCSE